MYYVMICYTIHCTPQPQTLRLQNRLSLYNNDTINKENKHNNNNNYYYYNYNSNSNDNIDIDINIDINEMHNNDNDNNNNNAPRPRRFGSRTGCPSVIVYILLV